MEDYRSLLSQAIEESVSKTVESVAEEEDDDPSETTEEVKPKAWLELMLVEKEHHAVEGKYEAQRKKKKTHVKQLLN